MEKRKNYIPQSEGDQDFSLEIDVGYICAKIQLLFLQSKWPKVAKN